MKNIVLLFVLFIAVSSCGLNHNGKTEAIPYADLLIFNDEFIENELDTTKWSYRKLGKRNAAINVKDAIDIKMVSLLLKYIVRNKKTGHTSIILAS